MLLKRDIEIYRVHQPLMVLLLAQLHVSGVLNEKKKIQNQLFFWEVPRSLRMREGCCKVQGYAVMYPHRYHSPVMATYSNGQKNLTS